MRGGGVGCNDDLIIHLSDQTAVLCSWSILAIWRNYPESRWYALSGYLSVVKYVLIITLKS